VKKGPVAALYDENKQTILPTWAVDASSYGLCYLRHRVSSMSKVQKEGCWQSTLVTRLGQNYAVSEYQ
jgi:hypothetical protein